MSRVLAVCVPASDVGFVDRVQRVISRDQWDLDSPDGVALMQAVLRATYPMATVLTHGVSAGLRRRTVALDVYRDGPPGEAGRVAAWSEAVYDRSGATAYGIAARLLGEGVAAESVVEQAFQEVRASAADGLSVQAGGEAVESAALRLATAARGSPPPTAGIAMGSVETSALAERSFRIGGVRRTLSRTAVERLLSAQREALELSVLEDLKVTEIAERMQTTSAVVHGILRDALLAVGSGGRPTAATTLLHWREAQRSWARLPANHVERPGRSLAVAHAWLDFQIASRAVRPGTVILLTDADRRFVAVSPTAARTFARPSVVGLRIDDVTAAHARALVPELWSLFETNGSMQGEYDCDRPHQLPIRTQFRGIWGRPLPDLQVGYLQPPVAVQLV